MKPFPPLFMLAVLGFCAWQNRELLGAWRSAPFDRFDPLVFALWSAPIFLAWKNRGPAGRGSDPTLLVAGAAASLLGVVMDMNVLQQVALALVLGSLTGSLGRLLPWLLAAAAWMPVFGYVTSGLGLAGATAARFLVAVVASVWGCRLTAPAGNALHPAA